MLTFFYIFIIVISTLDKSISSFQTIQKFPFNLKKGLTSVVIASSLCFVDTSYCMAQDTSSDISKSQFYGLTRGDRLLGCKTMGNCISTSAVKSVEKYSRPWTYDGSADEIYEKIISIIKEDPFISFKESEKEKLYVHAEAKSAVPPTGIDDIEFVVNPRDKIIAYRSSSRETVMVGLQQPLGDGGSNKNRLESIRRKLGVEEMKLNNEVENYIKEAEGVGLFQMMNQLSQPNEVNFLDNSVPDKAIDTN